MNYRAATGSDRSSLKAKRILSAKGNHYFEFLIALGIALGRQFTE